MALLWMDGFEHYGTTTANLLKNYGANGSPSIVTTPRTGTYAVSCTASANVGLIWYIPGAARQIVGVAAGFRTSLIGNVRLISFMDATSKQVSVYVNANGGLTVFRGTTSLGTSTNGLIVINTYYHIEIKTVISNAAGSVEVRLNGVTVINLTGVDTASTTNESCTNISFGALSAGESGVTIWDDIVIWDTNPGQIVDFVGQARVGIMMPDGDTGTNTMSPSSGSSAYAMVDELSPNDDTDYLSATVVDQIATCTVGAPPTDVGLIIGVLSFARGRKTDAGGASVNPGTNGSYGSDKALDTAYVMANNVFEQNPETAANWQPSDLSSAKWTVKRTV